MEYYHSMADNASGGVVAMYNMFTGGALLKGAVFSLGIMPYISASIIMQLASAVVPSIARLQQEGLFDSARKCPLPALPRRIGIVTSLDGAAIRDIIKVLRRRYGNAHLVIRPTRVQGEGAAAEIARALAAIGAVDGVDVVIVGRGGGSIEDLWAFNEEAVARAIAACPVPTISAVGHETDVTIADFVAEVRARG